MLPTDLPPLALIALGVTLAIIFAINRFGWLQGQKATPATSSAATVAAVIVDSSALNAATEALDRHTAAIVESNNIQREGIRHTERLARETASLGEGVDKLRDEVIRSAARMK